MQNTVNQNIRNGVQCCFLRLVTYLPAGNNPANGLVTEILQCFTRCCFLTMWKNREYPLIMNGLRSFCSFFVLAAFIDFTHLARHTFATTITLLNGVPIETVSKMLGHGSIRTTQIYAKVVDAKIDRDMQALRASLGYQEILPVGVMQNPA